MKKVFKTGDEIQLKTLDKILEVLDEDGYTNGCFFPPELEKYCGKTLKVIQFDEVDRDRVQVYPTRLYVMFDWIDFKATSGDEGGKDMGIRVEKVIYQNPATVVFWSDGTKTTTKAEKGDEYNPTAGLAICYMKKMLGNAKACDEMVRWLPNSDKEVLTYKEANKRDRKLKRNKKK